MKTLKKEIGMIKTSYELKGKPQHNRACQGDPPQTKMTGQSLKIAKINQETSKDTNNREGLES